MVSEQIDKLQSLVNVVSSRTGLRVRDEDRENWRKTIKSRLKCLKFSTFEEYSQFLISDCHESKAEWNELAGLLTTGETYFFRDKGQFAIIENWILPDLLKRNSQKRTLRVWSAGCSTGEEPYSIAILIDDIRTTDYELRNWDILILGTDMNPKAIEKAERGVYSDWSFRNIGSEIRNRYFKKVTDGWMLDERIKRMVKIRQSNLIEDTFPDYASDMHDIDLIICRNVFIYFNSEAVSVIIRKFTDTLNEGGYLMTGHGELYAQNLGVLQAKMFPESVVYQKSVKCGVRTAEDRVSLRGEAEAILKPIEKAIIKKEIATPFKLAMTEKEVEAKIKETDLRSSLSEIKTLFNKGVFAAAIEKAGNVIREYPDNLDALYLMAHAYANMGKYEDASQYCRRAIEIDATAPSPYFLLAHIAEEMGNNEEAKDLLKKVIYLSPDFVPAYLELSGLYDQENDTIRAKKMRTTAMGLLEKLPPEATVEPYSGTTAGELLDYLQKRKNNMVKQETT